MDIYVYWEMLLHLLLFLSSFYYYLCLLKLYSNISIYTSLLFINLNKYRENIQLSKKPLIMNILLTDIEYDAIEIIKDIAGTVEHEEALKIALHLDK